MSADSCDCCNVSSVLSFPFSLLGFPIKSDDDQAPVQKTIPSLLIRATSSHSTAELQHKQHQVLSVCTLRRELLTTCKSIHLAGAGRKTDKNRHRNHRTKPTDGKASFKKFRISNSSRTLNLKKKKNERENSRQSFGKEREERETRVARAREAFLLEGC